MKNFFIGMKNWFTVHWPSRRRLIQVYTALLYNANLRGYIDGKIYQGNSKYLCVPGMNCYSCPGAVGACPLGSLQNALNASATRTSYYVFGIIGLYALIFARTICGFLCPIGFGQELLYKIKTPKLLKNRATRVLSYLKYVLLVVLVIAFPIMYSFANTPMPGFCKYICPAGTFEGGLGLLLNPKNQTGSQSLLDMLGPIFTWKFIVLVVVIMASVMTYRPFCRFLCPLGAIYGFFNGIALVGVKLDKNKCTDCGLCIQHCKMDVKHVGDHECINCGECIKVCPAKALSWKGSKIFVRGNDIPEPASTVNISLGEIKKLNFNSIMPAFATANGAPISKIEFKPFRPIMTEDNNSVHNGKAGKDQTHANESDKTAEYSANDVAEEKVKHTVDGENNVKPIKPKRDGIFWIRFGAWAAALVVLFGMLLYFNLFTVDNTTIAAGTEVGNSLTSFNATMYDGSQFDFDTALGEQGTLIVLWDDSEKGMAQIENTQAAFEQFKEQYPSFASGIKIYAISSIQNGKEIVEDNGWDDYDIIFATDGKDGIISRFNASNLIVSIDKNRVIKAKDTPTDVDAVYSMIILPYEAPEVNMICPDFDVKIFGYDENDEFNLLEKTVSPSDYLGKVLVLNFWGTWCTPCVGELPSFNRIANENEDVTVLAIHGKITEDVTAFIKRKVDEDEEATEWINYNITFAMDNLEGNNALVYKSLNGDGNYPMTYIIGKDGRITFIRMGSLTYEKLNYEVQAALNA